MGNWKEEFVELFINKFGLFITIITFGMVAYTAAISGNTTDAIIATFAFGYFAFKWCGMT